MGNDKFSPVRGGYPVPTDAGIPAGQQQFNQWLAEFAEIREGVRSGAAGRRLLVWSDVSAYLSKLGADPESGKRGKPVSGDTIPPHAPRDMIVANQVFSNLLTWTDPTDADLEGIQIWVSQSQSRDDAALVATVPPGVQEYRHGPISTQQAHTYWIRAVDYAGNHSPWCPPDAQGGYVVPPSKDKTLQEMLQVMKDAISESQLVADLNRRIDKIEPLESEMNLTKNKFTVRIQEDNSGQLYATGFGLIVYPAWSGKIAYDAGTYCELDGKTYRSNHDGNYGNQPGEGVYWWKELPGVPKSEFVVQADKFAHIVPNGGTPKPVFVVQEYPIGSGQYVAFLDGNLIANGTIVSRMIDTGAVVADKIAAGAIIAEKIQAGAVTADKITAGAITATKIAASAVTATKIAAGAVEAAHIDAGAITAAKIGAGAVTADKITAGAITADKIAANAVTATHVGANRIVSSSANIANLAVDTLSIAGNAVTIPVASYRGGDMWAGAGWATINSVTLSAGAVTTRCVIQWTGSIYSTSEANLEFQLLRNGTLLHRVDKQAFLMPSEELSSWSYLDTLAAYTANTYEVRWISLGDSGARLRGNMLLVLGVQR